MKISHIIKTVLITNVSKDRQKKPNSPLGELILLVLIVLSVGVGTFFASSIAENSPKKLSLLDAIYSPFVDKKERAGRFSTVLAKMGIVNVDVFMYSEKEKKYVNTTVSRRERQIAFVENLYIAGAFDRVLVEEAVFLLGDKNYGPRGVDWKVALGSVNEIMKRSGAYQPNINKFNAGIMLDNLFHSRQFDDEDVEEFLIFISQQLYQSTELARRNNVKKVGCNIISSESCKRFLLNAKKIGFTNPFFINQKEDKFPIDEIWINGAFRPAVVERISFLKAEYGKDLAGKFKKVRLLTGSRRLVAEFDGIGMGSSEEKRAEGFNYIAFVARSNKISPVSGSIFVQQEVDGFGKRTVFNNSSVTEAIMLEDIYQKAMGNADYDLVDSQSDLKGDLTPTVANRPNTLSCSILACKKLVEEMLKDKDDTSHKVVAILSNQPYILRQLSTARRAMIEVAPEMVDRVKFVPIGPGLMPVSFKRDSGGKFEDDRLTRGDFGLLSGLKTQEVEVFVSHVASEMAALLLEGYRKELDEEVLASVDHKLHKKRNLSDVIKSAVETRKKATY